MTIEEAKREYPPGTVFIPAHIYSPNMGMENSKSDDRHILIPNDAVYKTIGTSIIVSNANGKSFAWNGKLFYEGKKAFIISKPKSKEELLLEEAKKDYPVGTKFYAAHLKHDIHDNLCEVLIGDTFNIQNGGNIFITRNNNETSCNRNGWWNCILHEGRWANIHSLPEVKEKEVNEQIPSKWYIKVTEDNFEITSEYKILQKKYANTKDVNNKFEYDYIDNNGYGYDYDIPCSSYSIITDSQFLEYCKQNNIVLNSKKTLHEEVVFREIEDYSITIPIYTPKKQKTQEVQLLEVKKRRII